MSVIASPYRWLPRSGVVLYPNKPTGLTAITTRMYLAEPEDNWTQFTGGVGTLTVGTDGTAPLHSSVGFYNYPAGMTLSGVAATRDGHSIGDFFTGARTLYFYIMYQLQSTFVSHPTGVNKFIFFEDFSSGSNDEAGNYFSFQGTNGSSSTAFQMQIRTQPVGLSARDLPPNVSGQTGFVVNRGVWNQQEWLLTENTVGNSDGTLKGWSQRIGTDGSTVETHNYTDVQWNADTVQDSWDYLMNETIYGGTGSGTLAAAQWIKVNHMHIAVG